jgi:hypothetical protein
MFGLVPWVFQSMQCLTSSCRMLPGCVQIQSAGEVPLKFTWAWGCTLLFSFQQPCRGLAVVFASLGLRLACAFALRV